LNKIAKTLKTNPKIGLRSLNLAYNTLDFSQHKALTRDDELYLDENVLESLRFVQNMIEYVSRSALINHLDISGMGFQSDNGQAQLAELARAMAENSQSL